VIVLDTHVWIWWTGDPSRLSRSAARAIDGAIASSGMLISSMSVWEVGELVRRQRLRLKMDLDEWFARSEKLPYLRFVPIDNEVARLAAALGDLGTGDPADRMIAATAQSRQSALVTRDERLLNYAGLKTIW
jgi:PIN domain nuclease of toxin-antitoxin system